MHHVMYNNLIECLAFLCDAKFHTGQLPKRVMRRRSASLSVSIHGVRFYCWREMDEILLLQYFIDYFLSEGSGWQKSREEEGNVYLGER